MQSKVHQMRPASDQSPPKSFLHTFSTGQQKYILPQYLPHTYYSPFI